MTKDIIEVKDSIENNVLIMKCNYGENNEIKNETFRFNLLPENIDRRSGRISNDELGEKRKSKLSAATGVWEVGWYIPSKKYPEEFKSDALTQQIWQNKEKIAPEILAIAMYCVAKNKEYPIFDIDIIAPIPNHENDRYKDCKAVSIGTYLTEILKKNGNDNVKFNRHLLIKNIDMKTKGMGTAQKESFYGNNEVYSINKDSGNLNGKKILLVDDVITQGFTAEQCLNSLAGKASELYFYAAGTTKL